MNSQTPNKPYRGPTPVKPEERQTIAKFLEMLRQMRLTRPLVPASGTANGS